MRVKRLRGAREFFSRAREKKFSTGARGEAREGAKGAKEDAKKRNQKSEEDRTARAVRRRDDASDEVHGAARYLWCARRAPLASLRACQCHPERETSSLPICVDPQFHSDFTVVGAACCAGGGA